MRDMDTIVVVNRDESAVECLVVERVEQQPIPRSRLLDRIRYVPRLDVARHQQLVNPDARHAAPTVVILDQ